MVTVRLAVRTPFAGTPLLDFLATRAVPGVETAGPGWYARTLALPHGSGMVRLDVPDVLEAGQTAFVRATLTLEDLRDTTAATERARRLVDADCDPLAVAGVFAGDPVVGPLVRRHPGLRVPGHVDGNELAVRAVLGQQVSVAGARTAAARLTERFGRPVAQPAEGLTHLFPDAATLAGARPGGPADAAVPRAGADRAVRRTGRRRRSPSTAARTATTYAPGCSTSPASGRGPPTTSRSARSATPTSSSPPTSAPGTRSPRSGTTRRAPPSWPSDGDPGAPTRRCISGRP